MVEDTEILEKTSLDIKERAYATGKRKNSIAREWLKKGNGSFSINGKTLEQYFLRPVLQMIVNQPLEVIQSIGDFEIKATVKGGGLSGQAGAIRLGISRGIEKVNPDYRKILKENGYLTRDSRRVERKKPGQPGASKKFQFSRPRIYSKG